MYTIDKLKKKHYHDTWQKIKQNRHSYSTPWQISQRLTELTDETVILACKIALEKSGPVDEMAILALGGYAREQMAPFSDIDILILHRGRVTAQQEEFISTFTAVMWDIGTSPGIQIKGLKEVMKAAMEDEVVRTSFIDNRFLFGSKTDYNSFLKIINDKVMEKGKTEFLKKMKIDSVRTRNSKFRDSIFRLEPNIKEGTGGIRDINTIYWVCKILYKTSNLQETVKHGILTQAEYDTLIDNCGSLFSVRNELHYYHNRKYEVMSLEAQIEIAKSLGYSGTDSVHSVELFMRDYYIRAKQTAEITQKVINRTLLKLSARKLIRRTYVSKLSEGFVQYANTLTVSSKDIFFAENPKKLITLFSFAANKGLKLSDSICELIVDNLYLIDGAFIKEYGTLFTKTISAYPNSFRIVSDMYKCRVLQKMIPEFEGLECRPQFDYYHHYTVDEHTILALDYIDKLVGSIPPSLSEYQSTIQKLERKDLLALSIILHDIGKGQGKNHSIVGAKMSKNVCSRLGLNMDDTDTVCNMVEHHLLMSHIAQRRDLHDIDVIEHFTSFLNSVEELRLLFLLTYADMNAVGGATFNEWKNNLLKELYIKSEMAIENESVQEEFDIVLKRRRQKLEERCKKNMPEILEQSKTLDDEYVYSTKAVHIIRYLQLAQQVEDYDDIVVELDTREDMNSIEVIVCARDRVGLLSRVCGAITSLSYNIKWAKIYTLENDITIDNILIGNPFSGIKMPADKQETLKARICDTVKDSKNIISLINKSKSILKPQTQVFAKKDKIVFDNKVSTQYTVVDIYAKDRIGLLYDILCTFSRLELSVERAKISTDIDRVVDSFYLIDKNGNKITCETTLERIREELSKKTLKPRLYKKKLFEHSELDRLLDECFRFTNNPNEADVIITDNKDMLKEARLNIIISSNVPENNVSVSPDLDPASMLEAIKLSVKTYSISPRINKISILQEQNALLSEANKGLVELYNLIDNKKNHQIEFLKKNKLENIINSAGESIVEIDDKKNTIVYINQKFIDTTGYSRKDCEGLSFIDIVHHEHIDSYLNTIKVVAEEKTSNIEMKLKVSNGAFITVNAYLTVINNGEMHFEIIFEDISKKNFS